ncbi:GNAT family N-acetyltransferase [Rhizobium sp. L1K21]|uniref:GNAT family N-acetyltransferase n=1 Tax=Rhizobium sp. L1K21 TaxID=2954933 RepID=UPI002092D3F1|nr:GNAT family protein [Rhizobium sp. L1K21]MCO6187093.1 GNAT family N-acetyltransferase [Rhizobium sp. L1K21]
MRAARPGFLSVNKSGNFSVNANELVEAGVDDIPAVMEIERGEGYARLVGKNSADEHRALMGSDGVSYLLLKDEDGAAQGFALLTGLGSPDGIVLLQRIALRMPGQGNGQVFLSALVDRVFADPAHFRFWLDVLEHNDRARRACRAAGFVEEGILRESRVLQNGQRANLVVMSILRGDWLTAFM